MRLLQFCICSETLAPSRNSNFSQFMGLFMRSKSHLHPLSLRRPLGNSRAAVARSLMSSKLPSCQSKWLVCKSLSPPQRRTKYIHTVSRGTCCRSGRQSGHTCPAPSFPSTRPRFKKQSTLKLIEAWEREAGLEAKKHRETCWNALAFPLFPRSDGEDGN